MYLNMSSAKRWPSCQVGNELTKKLHYSYKYVISMVWYVVGDLYYNRLIAMNADNPHMLSMAGAKKTIPIPAKNHIEIQFLEWANNMWQVKQCEGLTCDLYQKHEQHAVIPNKSIDIIPPYATRFRRIGACPRVAAGWLVRAGSLLIYIYSIMSSIHVVPVTGIWYFLYGLNC